MTKVQKFKLLVIILFGLPLIICGQGQPVLVKNPNASPVPVNIVAGSVTNSSTSAAVTNAAGTVLQVHENGISTNAIIGGNIQITNFPASLSQTNGSGVLKTDPSNATNLTVNLPSGAATSSLQTAGNTQLANILAAILAGITTTNNVNVSNFTNGTINLPSGAATSSLQTAGNNQLASILAQLAAGLATTNFPSSYSATQGTSPWVVSGTTHETGTVTVTGQTGTTGTVTTTQANLFSNNIAQVGGTATGTSLPVTNGPVTLFHLITTASTNTNLIKTGAGVLYFVHPMNVTSTAFNIHIFDRASMPVTNSTRLLQVQAAVLASGGGLHADYQPMGIPFSNGLAIATSLTSSETNLTAISAASGIDIGYK